MLSLVFPPLASAAPLWDRIWDGGDSEAAHGLAVDAAGSVYTTGNSSGNINIVRLSSGGVILSTWTYDSGNLDAAWSLWLDASGNAYAAGQTYNGSNLDFRFVKFTSTGGLALTGTYDSGGSDLAWGVVGAADGSFVVGGNAGFDMRLIKYAANGAVVWSKAYDSGLADGLMALTGDASGYVYAAGYHDDGGDDVKTIKFDPAGNVVWQSTFSTASLERARGVAVDASGNVYVVGYKGNDFLLLKYGPSGTLDWSRTWDSGKNDLGYAVAVDAAGQVFAAGSSEDSASINNDFRLWRYDADGNLVSTTLYEDAFLNSEARAVAFDGAGGVYLGGLGSGSDYRVLKDSYSPVVPTLSSAPFSGVFGTSVTVNWASTFPSGTQYQAQLSSTSDFSGSMTSSATLNLSATFTGLALYATYYARVATAPAGPYTAVASTRTPLFTAVPVLGSGLISMGAAWGDYDKDGDLDAFVANTANMDALLLRNDGNGVLTQVVITAVARNAGSAAWADADGDGDLDALLANNTDSSGAVLLRNDGGTWTPATVSNTAGAGVSVAWGDYDNDGDPDGLLARDSGQDEVLLRNDGGVLTGLVLTGTGGDSKGAAWADYDGDGDLDALVSNAASEVLLRNDGGTLTALTVADTAGTSAGMAWGDLDGDGLPEAVVAGDWFGDIAVLRSTAGVLVKTLLPATSGVYGVAVADFDADGDLDILAAANAVSNKEFLLRNDGGTFTKQVLMQTGDATSAAAWADFDADGDLDALLANWDAGTDEVLLRNDAAPYNPPPSAPAVESLVAEPGVSGGTLTVKWAAGAYDGVAPAAGLNFAVVMTTAPMALSPDGLRVISPSSFTVSWNYGSPLFGPYPRAAYRVWPGDVTAKHGLYFRVDLGSAAANIRSGATYYVRLQTIDAGLARSSWGAQASVFVPSAGELSASGFGAVSASSLSVNWASTLPSGTSYIAQLSTASDFSGTLGSSATLNLSSTFSGLSANTSYYARVSTFLAGPFTALGSTITLIQAPTAIVFDEISTTTLVVAAYSPSPAFSNLNAGLSGTNIAKGGVYAGWHGEGWTAKAGMAAARYGLAAAAAGGRIYALGGWTSTAVTANAAYDPLTNSWSAKAPMPSASNAPGAVSLGGKIYAVAGEDSGGYLSLLQRYDPQTDAWSSAAALPTERTGVGAAVLGGKIFSLGGLGGSGYITTVDAYDPATDSWASRGPMTRINHAMAAAEVGGRLYSLAGFDGVTISSGSRYEPGLDSWSTVSSAPFAVSYPAFAAIGGKIYLFGGSDGVGAIGATQEYDPSADVWTLRTSLPTTRGRAGGAVVAGRAYVVGGVDGSALATNEEYDPGTARQFTGLTPNTQYTFTAKARNAAGTETGTVTASTYTAAAVPTGSALAMVGASSLTLSWGVNGNPAGTQFQASLSTESAFLSESAGAWTADATSASFTGLSASTTYYARVRARNAAGVATEYDAVQSTRTGAAPVGSLSSAPVSGVFVTSLTVNWGSTFPGGTQYTAQLSTVSDYSGTLLISTTLGLSASFTALSMNTSYYARVATAPAGPFTALGSTRTLRTPMTLVWDGGGSTNLASEAANWVGDSAPQAGDAVLFDGTNGSKYCAWNLGTLVVSSFTMAVGFSTTVVSNGLLTVLNDFSIAGGTLTGSGVTLKGNLVQTGGAINFAFTNIPRLIFSGTSPQTVSMTTGSSLGILYIAAGSTVTAASGLTMQSLTYVEGADYRGLRGTLRLGGGFSHTITDQISSAQNYGDLEPGSILELGGSTLTLRLGNIPQYDVRGTVRMDGGDGVFRLVQDGPEDTWCNLWLNGPSARLVTDSAQDIIVSSPGMIMVERGASLDVAGLTLDDVSLVFVNSFSTHIVSASGLRFMNQSPGRGYAAFAFESNGLQGAATFLDSFFDVSVTTNVDASPLAAGVATITFVNAGGPKAGAAYENDPNNAVIWPALSSAPFTGVFGSSLSVNWGSSFQGGTQYTAQVATASDFSGTLVTSATLNLSAAFSGLSANTSYYARVSTSPSGPFTALGSTTTLIQAPTALVFGEISSTTLVAAAYSPTPAFTNLGLGLSGTNIAKDGVYAGWHGESWTAKAALPAARYALAAAALNGRLYALGGWTVTSVTTNAEYDPLANAWTGKAALPVAANSMGVAALGGAVYAVGGENAGGLLSGNRRYDPAANAWTSLQTLPSSRTGVGLAVLGRTLVSLGGLGASGYIASVSAYDADAGVWSARASLPGINHAMTAVEAGGRVYSLGGYDGAYISSAARYDPGLDAWSAVAPMPYGVAYPAYGVIGGKVYVFGGSVLAGPIGATQEYDPAQDAWTVRAAMPTARGRAAGAVIAGRAYVVGGTNGSTLAANEAYDPGTAQQFTGLTPNTQYTFTAKARNAAGTETGTVTASTYTAAAVPTGAAFAMVAPSSLTFSWSLGGNPAGTQFQAAVSTLAGFGVESAGAWTADASSALFAGLTPETTYYARVRARNAVGVVTEYAASASTRTPEGPATRYWDGGGTSINASEAANWVGDRVPRNGDSVVFSTPLVKFTFFDLPLSLSSLTLSGSYGGPAVVATTAMTIGTVQLTTGVFQISNASVSVTGDVLMSGYGRIQWGNGRVRVGGNMRIDSPYCCAYSAGDMLEFYGTGYQVVTGTGRPQLPHVEVTNSSGVAFVHSSTVEAHSFSLFAGTFTLGGSGRLRIGAWRQTGGHFAAQASTVTFMQLSAPNLATVAPLAGNPFRNLEVGFGNNGIAYLRALGPLEVGGAVTVTTGAFDGGAFTHVVRGDWSEPGGPSQFPAGTLRLSGAGEQRLRFSAFTALNALEAASQSSVTVQAGSTLTVAALSLGAPGLTPRLRLRSSTAGSPWYLVVTGTASVSRAQVSDSVALGGIPVLAAAGDSVNSGGNRNWDFGSAALGAPGAPVGTVLGTSSVSWTWAAIAGAEGYQARAPATGALLAAPGAPAFLHTGLSPNSAVGLAVAALAETRAGALSASATVYTPAMPPSGTAAAVYPTSATLSWGLNGNPAGTTAEVQRSSDAASYASVFTGTAAAHADAGLQGCSTYYYRVRNRGFDAAFTAFDAVVSFATLPSTPLGAGELSAESLPGSVIRLSWVPSPDPGLTGYRLYHDSGTGTVDYAAPLASLGASATGYTTGTLANGVVYRFGLRALNRCGREEGGLGAVTAAPALGSLSGVRAAIKVPASGKRISGNRVLVMAELVSGEPERTRQVLFQYRASSGAAWADIPAANLQHGNPDAEHPYFVHWDVTGLAPADYDLRAVATDVFASSDPAPGLVSVSVDPVNFEMRETDQGGGRVKKEQTVNNAVPNTVTAAESGCAVVTKVLIPAGAVSASTTVVTVQVNPAGAPAHAADVVAVGATLEVNLGSGQSLLAGGQTAALVFNYPDSDGDGVVDGTTLRAANLSIVTYDAPSGQWKKEFGAAVDETARTVTGHTPHFSFFSLVGAVAANLSSVRVYPNPYKPSGGNPDEGRPFSTGDPLSGILFDNLPASVRITIYTLTGSEVASFGTDAGTGTVQWDARNDSGQDVASGGYFAVIKSPGSEPVIVKLGVVR